MLGFVLGVALAASPKFAPVDLAADLTALPAPERAALVKLVEASKLIDTLYLRQVWAGNEALLLELAADATPGGRARLAEFLLHKGPWSRLDNVAFIPGAPAKPEGANFYPPQSSKTDIETWLATLGDADRKLATGFFTTIRRQPNGKLTAVPYSVEYQSELGEIAKHLREAADLTAQPTLKTYLTARADALSSNDYYASDVAWMELDASIEPTIGPYEVYEDAWFNAKAAFESFITLRDDPETAKLTKLSSELQGLEDALPIDAAYRNSKLGALAPIRVVNSIYGAGEANRGVQTAAFNLPNDERVTREKGAKRVMLKNVQEAKFAKVLQPIAKVVLAPADQKSVTFEAFFTHILMHELMHGLGPHATAKGTVRGELKETYSAIEEAKADVSGLWALQQLVDKGVLDKSLERTMYVTYLASMFRAIRFGVVDAHGKAVAVQLNTFLDAGAVTQAKGVYAIDDAKMRATVKALTGRLMMLQATGDRVSAAQLLQTHAIIRPDVQKTLDKLSAIPVDIAPRFVTAEKLMAEAAK